MPKQEIVNLKLDRMQVLDQDGNYDPEMEPNLSNDDLDKMYRYMILTRVFDQKAFSLQRQGRMLTYAPVEGQEACQIGSAYALKPEDWVFPTYRDHGAGIVRGIPLHLMYLYWMGNEEGCKIPKDVNNFPVAIPIASQIIHGVGLAIAAKIKNKKLASLVYFGDGATSEGEFHEGLNFAGVFKAPVVFVCQNNQYAISVSREKQTASQTIAQKAFAYGLDGIQVDGMDVLAVYKATKDALEKAKNDGTPTLIECVTYRFGPHTTADDPTKYRSDEEVAKWREKDPLKRFRIYLEKKGIWSKEYEEKVHAEAKALVEKAVQEAEATQPPAPDEMFKYTYSEQIPELYEQLEELKNILKEKPKE